MGSMIGKQLGGYRIEGELGKGGMGVVYLARQLDLDRRVALKLLPVQFTMDEGFVRRFRREARAIAQLNHPNIVQVYDIGEQDGAHYYAMELVEGETLDDRVFRKQRLDVTDAVRTVVQVCRGLRAMHEAGIVHRDIKPANILFDRRGHVKVTDFGIALHGSAERLTSLGTIVGTPEYMSPEQANGKTATPQSDIYSLGIVFYEMLTGRVPFDNADSLLTLQQQQFDEPRPPSALNPDVSPDVERVVLKMLAKEPEVRYQSCAEIVEDLRLIVRGDATNSSAHGVLSTGARGTPRPGGAAALTRWGPALGVVALVVAAVGLVLALRRADDTPGASAVPVRLAPPRVPDAEVLVGLLSLHAARAEMLAARDRVTVHLANGGVLAVPEAQLNDAGATLTLPDLGSVVLPRRVLAADAPLEPRAAAMSAPGERQAARAWAHDVYETWKLEHQTDFVRVNEMPALLEQAAPLLPPLPPPPHAAELRALAAAGADLAAARAAATAAEAEYERRRAAAPDASLQFPDRVVLASGRQVMCRILDSESDLDTLRVELPKGGRMRIAFADVRHFERAYGQAATAAAQTREALKTHREQVGAAKARLEAEQAALAEATERHDAAVEALLAAAAPPVDPAAAADRARVPPPEPVAPAPPPVPVPLWEDTFTPPVSASDAWRVAAECGEGLEVAGDSGALVLRSDADLTWSRCPPHAIRSGLAVPGARTLEVRFRVDVERPAAAGVVACWVEVEGAGAPPLAYLLYSNVDATGAWPVGQAHPVSLIERPGVRGGEPGTWRTVELPIAADWAQAGAAPVTLTGLRVVHFREGADFGRVEMRFGELRVRGIEP